MPDEMNDETNEMALTLTGKIFLWNYCFINFPGIILFLSFNT
jgi:hypothetical protein